MHSKIYEYFEHDHARLGALLEQASADPDHIDMTPFGAYRAGILRHIGLEEKMLLPAVQRGRGEPLPTAARLRLDHGAIVAMLVPVPTHAIIKAMQTILERHNALEEGEGGLYEACEKFLGPEEQEALLASVRQAPDVPVLPHNPSPIALQAMRRAVQRAGYDPEELFPGKET